MLKFNLIFLIFVSLLPVKAIEFLQTGQSQSYYTYDDGAFQYGIEWDADNRYKDNGDGTISDNVTHLMWLKDATCLTRASWSASLNEIEDLNKGLTGSSCRDFSASYSDWRMPNLFEMVSLFSAEASINSKGTLLTRKGFIGYDDFLLTSSPMPEDTSKIFCVVPGYGFQVDDCGMEETINHYTAVRTITSTILPATGVTSPIADGDDGSKKVGVSVDARYIDNGDGTVTDRLSRLMWIKDNDCISASFETAPDTLATFNSSPESYECDEYVRKYNDWRLPNFFEMFYLQNASWLDDNSNPFGDYFKNGYLTNTIYVDADGSKRVYHVNSFSRVGLNSYIYNLTNTNYIKPVRSLSPEKLVSPLIPSKDNSFKSLTIAEVTDDVTCGDGAHLCANQHKELNHKIDGGYRLGETSRADDTLAWDINLKNSTQEEELDLHVVSVADGTVIQIEESEDNGDFVLIKHLYRGSFWYSFYLHIDKSSSLKIGQTVSANTYLGKLSNAITYPHLHFVVYNRYPDEYFKSVDVDFKDNPEVGGTIIENNLKNSSVPVLLYLLF